MRLTVWQGFFCAFVLLIFVGQSAAARISACPVQAKVSAAVEQATVPPCHQHVMGVGDGDKATAAPQHAEPADCCQQLGHCLSQGAAALLGAELNFTPSAMGTFPIYGYNRQQPAPRAYSLFRPPIAL